MAMYPFPSTQFLSENITESVGVILFHQSESKICLLRLIEHDEYILAKGRRNIGEARRSAAIRLLNEETGFVCSLINVDMSTRCPSVDGLDDDRVQHYEHVCEPIALQTRQIGEGQIKVIWWYVAAVDESRMGESIERVLKRREREKSFKAEWFRYKDALERLTFQMDRDVVKRAIDLVESTYG